MLLPVVLVIGLLAFVTAVTQQYLVLLRNKIVFLPVESASVSGIKKLKNNSQKSLKVAPRGWPPIDVRSHAY